MPLSSREASQFEKFVSEEREYKEVQTMITTYEKRGERRGRLSEKRTILVRLLAKKFGKLEDGIAKRIDRTTSARKLDSLLLALVDANSIDDLEV